jgi:hypothetical protein
MSLRLTLYHENGSDTRYAGCGQPRGGTRPYLCDARSSHRSLARTSPRTLSCCLPRWDEHAEQTDRSFDVLRREARTPKGVCDGDDLPKLLRTGRSQQEPFGLTQAGLADPPHAGQLDNGLLPPGLLDQVQPESSLDHRQVLWRLVSPNARASSFGPTGISVHGCGGCPSARDAACGLAADFGLSDHDAPALRSALGTISLTSQRLLTGYRPREAVTIARTPALTRMSRRQLKVGWRLRGHVSQPFASMQPVGRRPGTTSVSRVVYTP